MRPGFIAFCLAVSLMTLACDDTLEPVTLGWGDPRTFPNRIEIDLGFQGGDGAILAGTLMLPVEPGSHRSWVRTGGICQQEGPGGIDGAMILDWLTARFEL